jgi:hypothetical protein
LKLLTPNAKECMKYFKNGMTSMLHLEKLPTEETDEGLLSKVS